MLPSSCLLTSSILGVAVIVFFSALLIAAILDIKHLKHLVNETWDARTKWNLIGLQLDIDESTLTSIDGYKRGKAEDCYPEMLSIWLRRDGATWSSLLNVFESPTVSLPDVIKHVNCLPDTKKKKIGLL